MPSDLAPFAPWVRDWFGRRFERPTAAQTLGWPPIIAGEHVLLLAPTGSGTTLAAFLWGIDSIYRELREGPAADGGCVGIAHRPAPSASISRTIQ